MGAASIETSPLVNNRQSGKLGVSDSHYLQGNFRGQRHIKLEDDMAVAHGVRIDLPPVASPFFIVLAGTPILKSEQQKTTEQLMHKALFWLSKFSKGRCNLYSHLIMARRV